MSKLIERDAAVEVLNQLVRERFSLSDGFQFYIDALKDVELNVMALPTVDAVPVRCKDCKHHHYEKHFDKRIPYCDRINYGYGWQDNDFCSRGERKDGDYHEG